ncbi:SPOR domain-containing protein [Elizabethkingia argentiflava]|uniref:SPOR domain-containing protein n=1 Tax=Elizabethkingia argenteiflava TaxID=2681556 RepID=A0A845PWT4_9FLAO|nr:SPOR domain-containing protein [Elizabethkingia argenteiflava]NAW51663.1 SPOR domain-containing protein [Elizabethkingia argenteiflava]
MEKILKIGLIAALFCFQNICAQTMVTKSDSINGGVYFTQMDSRIDALLVKSEGNCRISKTPVVSNSSGVRGAEATDVRPFRAPAKSTSVPRSLTTADICRNTPKLSGYKIQVAITNNGADANRIRYEVRRNFPDLRIELDSSLRPNYKILAGSYFSKSSGATDLKRVRHIYTSAVLVPYRIFCVEAK